MIVGIDLGTTYSAVARLTEEGPKLAPNALGRLLTPSVVAVDDEGKLLVGDAAREYQVLRPDRGVSLFKRHMGSDWRTEIGGVELTPERLSALILESLKEDAESAYGESIEQAVITVPAYFNDPQRKATIRAGQMAGLRVERIINEPTAAAIAYGFHEEDEEKLLAVFDLGGGTFDISIVEFFEGTVEVRSSSGECFLGGEDITRTMVSRLLQRHGLAFEHAEVSSPQRVSRLLQLAEAAKRRLSQAEATEVAFPEADGSIRPDASKDRVTREELAEWIGVFLGRLETPIRRALGDARVKREEIDEVLLVGGATRMPAIAEYVERTFGKPPRRRINPDHVVALGAAVQAGLVADMAAVEELVVTDVAPFTLGVEISKQFGRQLQDGYFLPIINRNSTIPISRVERVQTIYSNQPSITVHVFQGESRKTEENLLLGELEVHDLPRGPAGQEVDIRFTYDLNGVLEVEATVVKTGQKVSTVIAKHARGMADRDIAQAVAEMQSIKRHPREDAANRFALRRAERLYAELSLTERDMLSRLLDAFEEALDLQEPDLAEQYRLQLEHFLNQFDGDASDGDPDEFADEEDDDDGEF